MTDLQGFKNLEGLNLVFECQEFAYEEHQAIRINRRSGKGFIIVSAEDWERDQETLYVLRNNSLMNQVAKSMVTYQKNSAYLNARI